MKELESFIDCLKSREFDLLVQFALLLKDVSDCHCITSNIIEVTYRSKCKLTAQVFLVVIDFDTLRLIDQSEVLISFVLNSSIFCHRTFQHFHSMTVMLIALVNATLTEFQFLH